VILSVSVDKNPRKGDRTMDEKYRLLIALGAASAANCIPCFEHYYDKALAINLTSEEIQEAVDLGNQMKTGAQMAFRNIISEIMGEVSGNGRPCSDPASQLSCCD
jgi:alkylhydroperoxidase/carboxymuconolactone decarboxylase family protein YurZ